jgi:hypothetical protein
MARYRNIYFIYYLSSLKYDSPRLAGGEPEEDFLVDTMISITIVTKYGSISIIYCEI